MQHAVSHSQSDTLGIIRAMKGCVYYPLQWAAGLAALFLLGQFETAAPSLGAYRKVALVRAGGIAANVAAPIDSGARFDHTPSENLYGGNYFTYAIQRSLYAFTMSIWPAALAIGLTMAMPALAPAFIGAGQGLTAAGTSSAAMFAGGYLQALPAAFAMPEGVTLMGMMAATGTRVFQVTLVASVITDLLNLEQWNPKHRLFKERRAESPTR